LLAGASRPLNHATHMDKFCRYWQFAAEALPRVNVVEEARGRRAKARAERLIALADRLESIADPRVLTLLLAV
jgi:hypothetical protein